MLGAVELLMIAVILGIIFGRDAIDRTFRKHADEGVVESLTEDVKDYYKKDPRRLIKTALGVLAAVSFIVLLFYWAFTRTDLPKMLGLGQ